MIPIDQPSTPNQKSSHYHILSVAMYVCYIRTKLYCVYYTFDNHEIIGIIHVSCWIVWSIFSPASADMLSPCSRVSLFSTTQHTEAAGALQSVVHSDIVFRYTTLTHTHTMLYLPTCAWPWLLRHARPPPPPPPSWISSLAGLIFARGWCFVCAWSQRAAIRARASGAWHESQTEITDAAVHHVIRWEDFLRCGDRVPESFYRLPRKNYTDA